MKRTLLCAALITVLFCGVGESLTLSELRTQVRRNVRDTATDTTLQRYSDTIIDTILNEGQRDFVNSTWALELSSSQALTVNTTYYDLGPDFIAIQHVRFVDSNNDVTDLEEISERSLRQKFPNFNSDNTGKPVEYFIRPSTNTDNTFEISFQPVPTASGDTGTAYYRYYNQATDMSADSDVPLDGERQLYPYHDALAYYATAKIKLIQGAFQEAQFYGELYNNWVKTAVDRLGRAPNYNPSFKAGPIRD